MLILAGCLLAYSMESTMTITTQCSFFCILLSGLFFSESQIQLAQPGCWGGSRMQAKTFGIWFTMLLLLGTGVMLFGRRVALQDLCLNMLSCVIPSAWDQDCFDSCCTCEAFVCI